MSNTKLAKKKKKLKQVKYTIGADKNESKLTEELHTRFPLLNSTRG